VKPAPVVRWLCSKAEDACEVAAVFAAPAGPEVLFRRRRMSEKLAAMAREGDRDPGPPRSVPLADLHHRGVFGPVACKHHVFVELTSADLQDDYDQGIAERRIVKRFLRD